MQDAGRDDQAWTGLRRIVLVGGIHAHVRMNQAIAEIGGVGASSFIPTWATDWQRARPDRLG